MDSRQGIQIWLVLRNRPASLKPLRVTIGRSVATHFGVSWSGDSGNRPPNFRYATKRFCAYKLSLANPNAAPQYGSKHGLAAVGKACQAAVATPPSGPRRTPFCAPPPPTKPAQRRKRRSARRGSGSACPRPGFGRPGCGRKDRDGDRRGRGRGAHGRARLQARGSR